MPLFKRSVLILSLLVLCVGCDQITKDVARHQLAFEPPKSWLHDTIRLEYAENTGVFLSFGGDFSEKLRVVLFQVFPALGLVVLTCVLFATPTPLLPAIAWSLVLSGGVGNLLDRMLYDGRVVDFMNLGIGGFRTGIFNVADVCITIGVLLLIAQAVWPQRVSSASDMLR
jgi:signal peptidase II